MDAILDRKKLEVNVEKTKMMRFRKGEENNRGGMQMEGKEDRGGERILLSRIQIAKERGQEGYVRERIRKAGTVIRQV